MRNQYQVTIDCRLQGDDNQWLQIKKQVKLKNKEPIYFDHPHFAVIVGVTPVEIEIEPAPSQEAESLEEVGALSITTEMPTPEEVPSSCQNQNEYIELSPNDINKLTLSPLSFRQERL